MQNKTRKMNGKIASTMFKLGILLLCLLGAIKMIFFGLVVDEEYAVTMAYRMVSGDIMLLDMWEPHQTSGFVCAFFIRLYLMMVGTTDYLVVYLRVVGVLLQLSVSLFVYGTVRKFYYREPAFWAAVLSFHLLPKWIQTPEFSNILLWSNLCTMMCFLHFVKERKYKRFWLFGAALFYCMAVLAYPTCLLLLPVYLWGIACQDLDTKKKDMLIFTSTCVIIGLVYILSLLSRMNLKEFIYGIRQMTTDGQHSDTLLQRLGVYGQEMLGFIPQIMLVSGCCAVLLWIICKVFGKRGAINKKLILALLVVVVANVYQLVVWNSNNYRINEKMLFYYLTFCAGICFTHKKAELYWFGILPSITTVISVLLITNTTISVTGTNLLPGIIAGGIMIWEYMKEESGGALYRIPVLVTGIVVMGLFMFAKGYMVCENEGIQSNIFYVKQKALSGPAKGIYCRYVEGYAYNELAELIQRHVDEEDAVLYVGNHSLRYLLGDGEISTYSTISTPTYDERLWEYWEKHPYRYPTIIIEENGAGYTDDIHKILQLHEPIAESNDFRIYQVVK